MITDEDRISLGILCRQAYYQRAKEEVLRNIRVEVIGSSRDASQTALDLAVKEGVHMAFHAIENLAKPANKQAPSPLPTNLTRRRTSTESTEE